MLKPCCCCRRHHLLLPPRSWSKAGVPRQKQRTHLHRHRVDAAALLPAWGELRTQASRGGPLHQTHGLDRSLAFAGHMVANILPAKTQHRCSLRCQCLHSIALGQHRDDGLRPEQPHCFPVALMYCRYQQWCHQRHQRRRCC